MKITWHLVAQVAAMIIQYANLATNVVPPQFTPYVAVVVGFCQVLLHVYATNQPAPVNPQPK